MRGENKFLNSGAFYKKNSGSILGGDPNRGCGGLLVIVGIIVLLFLLMVFFG